MYIVPLTLFALKCRLNNTSWLVSSGATNNRADISKVTFPFNVGGVPERCPMITKAAVAIRKKSIKGYDLMKFSEFHMKSGSFTVKFMKSGRFQEHNGLNPLSTRGLSKIDSFLSSLMGGGPIKIL